MAELAARTSPACNSAQQLLLPSDSVLVGGMVRTARATALLKEQAANKKRKHSDNGDGVVSARAKEQQEVFALYSLFPRQVVDETQLDGTGHWDVCLVVDMRAKARARALFLLHWMRERTAVHGFVDGTAKNPQACIDGTCPVLRPRSIIIHIDLGKDRVIVRVLTIADLMALHGYDNGYNLSLLGVEQATAAIAETLPAPLALAILIPLLLVHESSRFCRRAGVDRNSYDCY
jgi:hypothetical protein